VLSSPLQIYVIITIVPLHTANSIGVRMPKYKFECACGYTYSKFLSIKTTSTICPQCNREVKRSFPIVSMQTKEVIDRQTGVEWVKDQEEQIKERRDEHYWRVEVPRLVQTVCLETALENDWMYYDDKGELKIRTKPPR